MMRDIFLVGAGQTRFGEWWELGIKELMGEAMYAALKEAPCSPEEIDFVIVANMLAERTNGQAHLGAVAAELLPHAPPALRVESACGSGAIALHTACGLLESGRAKNVLVVGAEKMTDVSTAEVSAALMGAADSEHDAPCGLTFPGIFGLIAKRYMFEHGLTRERLNAVSARHHKNAMSNPFAQFRMEVPAEQVSKSPAVADPLCMLDCSPVSDGAAACILSTAHESDVRFAASQIGTDAVSLTQRASITTFAATKKAMKRALVEADIGRDQISHLELHDCFSMAAVINLEDLGFAEAGKGIELYEQEDPVPSVNLSGGLKACGHPVAATGVKQVIDIAKQLRLSGNRWGLTQNFGGACGSCGIHILEHTHV